VDSGGLPTGGDETLAQIRDPRHDLAILGPVLTLELFPHGAGQ
jgi:hypothetical protein